MSYTLEVIIPSTTEIKLVFREDQGLDVFEKGRELEGHLRKSFPEFSIQGSNWETREGERCFYEIKIKYPQREAEATGKQIFEKAKEFSRINGGRVDIR